MTLQYALSGDWTQDPSLTAVRQQVFDDNLLVLTIDSVQSSTGGMTFNGGHSIGDFPIVTQQLMPLMINDQVNGQQLLRFPGAMFQSAIRFHVAGRDRLQRLRGADSRRQRADASGGGANDHQLAAPPRADPGYERGGRVCPECDHRLRSQRHGRLADQLSVSIGKHERFRAAGQSGVTARPPDNPVVPVSRTTALRPVRRPVWAVPLRPISNTAPTPGQTA